jgi:hypothetical protein
MIGENAVHVVHSHRVVLGQVRGFQFPRCLLWPPRLSIKSSHAPVGRHRSSLLGTIGSRRPGLSRAMALDEACHDLRLLVDDPVPAVRDDLDRYVRAPVLAERFGESWQQHSHGMVTTSQHDGYVQSAPLGGVELLGRWIGAAVELESGAQLRRREIGLRVVPYTMSLMARRSSARRSKNSRK